MTRDVVTVPDATLVMDDLTVGALPVCNGRRLAGINTDRDETSRGDGAPWPE